MGPQAPDPPGSHPPPGGPDSQQGEPADGKYEHNEEDQEFRLSPSMRKLEEFSHIPPDSGYISPNNTAPKSNITLTSLPKPMETVLEKHSDIDNNARVQHNVKSRNTGPESSVKIVIGEGKFKEDVTEKLPSSPKVKEGLMKKLEQQPVKRGVVRGELKSAAKSKCSAGAPLRAMAVEEASQSRKYSGPDSEEGRHRTVSPRHRKTSDSGSDKEDTREHSFTRKGSVRQSGSSDKRRSLFGTSSPVSASPVSASQDVLVYSPECDEHNERAPSSRESSRPSSRASSKSDYKENVKSSRSGSRESPEHKSKEPQMNDARASDQVVMERNTRSRASAREARSVPREEGEKRSSSAGAPVRLVEKPPVAKPVSKDKRSMSREEVKARRRTRSDHSQGSSEDEESRSDRRHSSGNTSSSSEREGSGERAKPVTSHSTSDAKDVKAKPFSRRR